MKIRCKFRFLSPSRVLFALVLLSVFFVPRISKSQSKTPTPKITAGQTSTVSAPTATARATSIATKTAAPIPTVKTTQTPPRTPTAVTTVRTGTPMATPTKTRCPTRTVAPTPSACTVNCTITRCPCQECKLICDPLTCTCELSMPQSSLPATLSEAAINGQPAASDITNITQGSTIIKLSPSGPSMGQAIRKAAPPSNPGQCGATPTPEPTNKSCPEILGLESLAQGWSMSVTVRREGPPPQPTCAPTISIPIIPTVPYYSECVDETPTPAPTPGATPSGIYHEFVCAHQENGTVPFEECAPCESTPEPLLPSNGDGGSSPAPSAF